VSTSGARGPSAATTTAIIVAIAVTDGQSLVAWARAADRRCGGSQCPTPTA
jgi:hypothetical protein